MENSLIRLDDEENSHPVLLAQNINSIVYRRLFDINGIEAIELPHNRLSIIPRPCPMARHVPNHNGDS